MAGTFSDVPGYRFIYELDGTLCITYTYAGGTINTIPSADIARLNQEQAIANSSATATRIDTRTYISGSTNNNYIVFLFPESRSVAGYFLSTSTLVPTGGRIIQTSADTTNGQDGTWTTVASPHGAIDGSTVPISPSYRTEIRPVTWSNVKAVRVNLANIIWAFHMYGTIATSASPNRLRIVDVSNNDIAAQLDFGNLAQRSSATKQFKVINQSATQTANNITVGLNTALNSDSSPSLIGQYQVSTDNIAFANAVNIGNLAPGASSATMYVRMAPSATAQLGPWALRITAHPVSWS